MGSPIEITVRQLIELHRGLGQMDAAKSGKGEEMIPFDFDPKTRYRLMKAADIVAREKVRFDKACLPLAQKHGVADGMERNEVNAHKVAALNLEIEPMLDEKVELVGILLISVESLIARPLAPDAKKDDKPKTNPIPQTVLNRLAPIIAPEDES